MLRRSRQSASQVVSKSRNQGSISRKAFLATSALHRRNAHAARTTQEQAVQFNASASDWCAVFSNGRLLSGGNQAVQRRIKQHKLSRLTKASQSTNHNSLCTDPSRMIIFFHHASRRSKSLLSPMSLATCTLALFFPTNRPDSTWSGAILNSPCRRRIGSMDTRIRCWDRRMSSHLITGCEHAHGTVSRFFFHQNSIIAMFDCYKCVRQPSDLRV